MITAAGSNVSKKSSSSRLQTTRTGLPDALARRAASTACCDALLPPKPPPTYGVMTRTWSSDMFSARATCDLSGKGVCVPAQTVTFPFSMAATAECVSMGACAT